ncbi:hypothetical protein CEXT_700171 [Caerostris extrusa]|uniref:Uncharacterized protein n=1 Tax=Caerostris extrusa TaxID=172846 RepID=A0AAV4XPW5_CAEEX|nr:hypothetical protein CEXT_700171 [Caerostris extrusa]
MANNIADSYKRNFTYSKGEIQGDKLGDRCGHATGLLIGLPHQQSSGLISEKRPRQAQHVKNDVVDGCPSTLDSLSFPDIGPSRIVHKMTSVILRSS